MIVLDFVDCPSLEPSYPVTVAMERKLSDRTWPPLPPPKADSPDNTDSARSTPEVGAEPKGAIPKSRTSSMGKLDAIRSSLREVSKNSSFKIGRKKQVEEGAKEEKKKSKKIKKKETTAAKTANSSTVPAATETPERTMSPQTVTTSTESLPTKKSKVSKATQLVRKLSIGRYRGKNNPKDGAQVRTLSPTSTSPELSPTASRTDVSEDEAPSVASSSASEGRQGPEGDDGAQHGSGDGSGGGGDVAPSTPPAGDVSPPLTPSSPQPPPPSVPLGQSRLIAGGANKGLAGQSRAPSLRGVPTATSTTASPPRQLFESTASRKDRDPLLETVPEVQSHEEASAAAATSTAPAPPPPSSPPPVEDERSPPETPAFQSASASLDEAAPPRSPPPPPQEAAGSRLAASAAFMSQRLSSAAPSAPAVDVATTKSQILSITTHALKKQQEEIRAAAATVAAAAAAATAAGTHAAGPSASTPIRASDPKPSTSVTQPVSVVVSPLEDPEVEQFGDVDDSDDPPPATSMSAPPPSAATVMAEARARLTQSLGGAEASAQPVNEKREHLYKILVIGELGTGKTSIIKRYVHQFFSQHYRATIGVDFALKVLNWDANTVIRLQLWDIAGQERFGNMTRVYYKEAVGAFIVFDVTRAATFDAVIKWKQDLDSKVQLADGSPIPCVLLANKCDQQKEGIVNQAAKMDEYCKERGFSAWFETSAKENINIEEAARCLVTKILQSDKLIHNENGKDNDKFALDGKAEKDEKSGKSCAC